MHWSLSTYLFRPAPLSARTLDQIAAAGFDSVEIYGERGHFDYANSSQVREIAQWAASSAMKINALHAPPSSDPRGTSPHSMVSIAFLDRQRRQDSMDEIKRVLESAEQFPVKYLILHLGVEGEEFDLRKFDAALTSLEHLRLFANQRGVRILLENNASELSTPRRLMQFFSHTHMTGVDVCLDTGHAQLDGGVMDAIQAMGRATRVVHLSDNNGMMDDHQFPPQGVVTWNAVLHALRQAAPEAAWTLEARPAASGVAALDQAVAARDQLRKLLDESMQEAERAAERSSEGVTQQGDQR